MEADRVRIHKKHKVGLITVGIIEIVFAISSITASAVSIALTNAQYWRCYYYILNHHSDYYDCGYNDWLYRNSVSSQGIWTGCMVIISASLNTRLATNPTKQMGSVSGGFSIISFILTTIMIILESLPVADGYYQKYEYRYYDYQIWAAHCVLLSFALALFILTLTNLIISYAVTGCPECCCKESTAAQPMVLYYHPSPMAGYPSAATAIQQPIPTQQMQAWQQIPSQTTGQNYLVPFPGQLQSNLAFVPEPHNQRPSNREATLIAQPHHQVSTLQTPSPFPPQQTQVGTVIQRSTPAVQHGQIPTIETWTPENSPTNNLSNPEERHPTNPSQILSQAEHF